MTSCGKCGQPHVTATGSPSCGGHVTTDRDSYVPGQPRKLLDEPRPCRRAPNKGSDVCGVHGASAPNVKAKGIARDNERKAAAVLRRFGSPIDTTPTEALLDAVKWTAGYVAWLRDKVAGVDEQRQDDEAKQAEQDERSLTQHSTVSGKREASVWVDLLGQWHDRLVRICGEAIKAGIEERRVRIAEQQGALVADVIRKILGDLELTPEQASKAGEVVPMRLRALAG